MATLLSRFRFNRVIYHHLRLFSAFSDKVITLEVDKLDVIDNFTSDLIQRRIQSQKWEPLTKVKKPACILLKPKRSPSLNSLSQEDLDNEFLHVVNDGGDEQVAHFINKCHSARVQPSFVKVLDRLSSGCLRSNVDVITALKELYAPSDSEHAPSEVFKAQGALDHYLAEAYWSKGEVLKALQLFEDTFRKHQNLRRHIKLMLKYLIPEVTTHSEAVLVSVVKFAERLYARHNDPFCLVCVWQACFVSEWYSDQQLAIELLEQNDLCGAIVWNLPYVVTTSLRQHRTDVVYRLLELLIKYERKEQYSAVLVSLFNYKFKFGDLKSCSEIIQWSVTYDACLPQIIHERFLMLLLKRTNIDDVKPQKPKPPTINLKF